MDHDHLHGFAEGEERVAQRKVRSDTTGVLSQVVQEDMLPEVEGGDEAEVEHDHLSGFRESEAVQTTEAEQRSRKKQ